MMGTGVWRPTAVSYVDKVSLTLLQFVWIIEIFLFLFFSRNQLSTIPPFICQLQSLEVLLASNNKLVSLPEEIGHLEKLMELVSIVNKRTNFLFKTNGLPQITLLFEFNFPDNVDVAIIVNKRSF